MRKSSSKKPKTHVAYRVALKYFVDSCSKVYLDEITRSDLLRFVGYLRDKGQAPRSIANKFENVCSFLKAQGVRPGLSKSDWPKYTEETPEIYSDADRVALFEACTSEERLWFTFFLQTGMREQEVMHTEWRDVDLTAGVVRVTHTPERGWSPKAYKEREVPIPDGLVNALRANKNGHAPKQLLFAAEGGAVKKDFLHCLKRVAKRAERLDPADCWLHKFRSTFATLHLWAGVDLRTVQASLGHNDLASTMRYLKPAHGAEVRAKVNATFA